MALNDVVVPLATRLLACLCTALEGTVAGPACRCCLYPGLVVPMDDCDCECGAGGNGSASVRVARIFPTKRFPGQSFDVEPCKANTWAVELVMTVYRCVAVLNEDGSPPSCSAVTDDAEKILSDGAAMRQAVTCCYPDADIVAVVGAWEPLGPNGGCAGGQMTITVQFYDQFTITG